MSQDEQQHRGWFVPIGELAGTPQARHHFTTLHQVNQLIEASEAEPDIGFMARLLALCSLPRTNPGDSLQFKRVNGPYTLGMVAGLGNKLPYGTLPRLLLAWVCTEAVRTQSRELVLGDSLSEFMRRLGIYSTSGGTTGGRTRLRNQMRRLFGCTVSLIYEDSAGGSHAERADRPPHGVLVEREPGRTRARYGIARSILGKIFTTRSSATRSRST